MATSVLQGGDNNGRFFTQRTGKSSSFNASKQTGKDNFRHRNPNSQGQIRRSIGHIERKRELRNVEFSLEQTVASEMLLQEEAGFLEREEGDVDTYKVLQREIRDAVDISSAAKSFDLSLHQFGPYVLDYTRNGRHLLLGGRRGHVAFIDWTTKRLLCEINVMEEVADVAFLHQETMFAVAQKEWVYMYDSQGVELHCIRQLNRVTKMEFLPYHFLLSTASDRGYLSWLDVSIGKLISQSNTRLGRLNVMCQNPYNAVIALGTAKGTVTMWSPNVKEPLATVLCHHRAVKAVAIDQGGTYMATSATDGSLKIWDVRSFNCVQSYRLKLGANNLVFSHRGLLAASTGNLVQIFRDCCTKPISEPYLRQNVRQSIAGMAFCPYEDVLGIGHAGGFSSLLIPGAGEPNFDALESNPYQTKSQRREAEVKSLLEKIQPEMICLDPSSVNKIKTASQPAQPTGAVTAKRPNPVGKIRKKDKMSGKKVEKLKNTIRDMATRKLRRKSLNKDKTPKSGSDDVATDEPYQALDRFKPKASKSL